MSARRPRTSGRRVAKSREGLADRDEEVGERSKQKKRKLSDLLGPPWTEDELKHFYQAYRRHGKDWRKVAATLPNRTMEMVEVLYSMNKAYLSLPEGAASSAGLIAMMTDHFNILEGSRSFDDESSEEVAGSDPSHQLPARLRNRSAGVQPCVKSIVTVPPLASGLSSYGGPSPAKKPRTTGVNRPRAVGKRTPRVPLMHLQDKNAPAKTSLIKHIEDLEQDSFGDCDEVQVALTLAAASQRVASPQISRTPACRTDRSRHSPAENGYPKEVQVGVDSGGSGTNKHSGSNMENGEIEGSEESKDTENGVVTKASTSAAGDQSKAGKKNLFPTGEAKSRPRRNQKPQTREGKIQSLDSVRFDDLKEECSCTEEGTGRHEDIKPIVGLKNEQAQKKKRFPSQKAKKRSRQLFSGDESSGLDALATLADLSLNGLLPSPRLDLVLAVKVLELSKDHAPATLGFDTREPTCSKVKVSGELPEEIPNLDAQGQSAIGMKESLARVDSGSIAESDVQRPISIADIKKRKRKGFAEMKDQFSDSNIRDLEGKAETKSLHQHGEEGKNRTKIQRAIPGQNVNKHIAKPLRQLEAPISGNDFDMQEGAAGELEVEHAALADVLAMSVRQKGRRKFNSAKVFTAQVVGLVDSEGRSSHPVYSYVESGRKETIHCPHATTAVGRLSNKVRLTHCLLSGKVRRWCVYEWFYSAIDLPWFARNEFVEYLNHAGLGHVPRLTRAEWGVIRGSLGKPRRLSKRFLQEEREKLEVYRDSVRKHYQEVRVGHRDGLPTDLPRPLTVGQRVIARHSKTKEIHDGSILTVERNRCRVQFDRPEMGVELVADIDAMPVNSLENLSEMLMRRSIQAEGMEPSIDDSKFGVKPRITVSTSTAARTALNEGLETPGTLPNSSSRYFLNALCNQAQAADTVDSVIQVKAAANEAVAAAQQAMCNQPCTLAQVQAREADIRALADLTRALDKKEALLLELRYMNDDADLNQKDGEAVRRSDTFQKQYATLLLQLKEVNQQVCGALLHLRQRNKYQENVLPPWHRSPLQQSIGLMNSCRLDSNACSLEQSPIIREVSVHAKHSARVMVNTALEAMLSLKEGEDALSKIGNVLSSLPKANMSVTQMDAARMDSATATACQASSCCLGLDSMISTDYAVAGHVKQVISNNGKDASFLAELMASCVATLFMVQAFTERQFPPADIAEAFDAALTSLQPVFRQNYAIYTDIEHYAGLLKNQIIALIPTPSHGLLPVDCPPAN